MLDYIEENNLKMDSFGNCQFQALVKYKSSTNIFSEMTEVKFIRNGYDDGKITVFEKGELKSENCYLEYSARFQNYKFSQKEFIIEGFSKKGVNYTVEITKI